MKIYSLLQFILTHPLNKNQKLKAIIRFAKWQLTTLFNPYPIIYQYTDNTKLILKKGMTGATQNLYCGLHDFQEMFFLLHFLRKDDYFIDVGANIGSYTILASAHVGARTVSFEPIFTTFLNLINNININNIEGIVEAHNIGVGSNQGFLNFTTDSDTINHVANNDAKNFVKVEVNTLDNLLSKINPCLLKIDVEGFETHVINGAKQILSNSELKAIIIELNGSGTRYGFNEADIHNQLLDFGFKPYLYSPYDRSLVPLNSYGSSNTIYVRDDIFVTNRLRVATKVKVLNQLI